MVHLPSPLPLRLFRSIEIAHKIVHAQFFCFLKWLPPPPQELNGARSSTGRLECKDSAYTTRKYRRYAIKDQQKLKTHLLSPLRSAVAKRPRRMPGFGTRANFVRFFAATFEALSWLSSYRPMFARHVPRSLRSRYRIRDRRSTIVRYLRHERNIFYIFFSLARWKPRRRSRSWNVLREYFSTSLFFSVAYTFYFVRLRKEEEIARKGVQILRFL